MAEWLRDLSIGAWYESEGNSFEIVGIDAGSEVVLIQHFDGSLEEIEFDVWLEIAAQPCAPPEDFSGALDLDRDDLDVDGPTPESRDSALKRIDVPDLY